MGLPGWVIRKVADGEAPSPYYAAIGLFDAAGRVPLILVAAFDDPRASLAGLSSAWRNPVKGFDALVERGYVRVLRDGAEVAVRAKLPRFEDELVGPARVAAGVYAKGRHRMPKKPRGGTRHH
jgi:hypothetical protein